MIQGFMTIVTGSNCVTYGLEMDSNGHKCRRCHKNVHPFCGWPVPEEEEGASTSPISYVCQPHGKMLKFSLL